MESRGCFRVNLTQAAIEKIGPFLLAFMFQSLSDPGIDLRARKYTLRERLDIEPGPPATQIGFPERCSSLIAFRPRAR